MFGCLWDSVVRFISAAETAKKSFCPSGLNLPELLKNDGENCGLMLNTRNSGFSGYEYDITFKPGSKPLLDMGLSKLHERKAADLTGGHQHRHHSTPLPVPRTAMTLPAHVHKVVSQKRRKSRSGRYTNSVTFIRTLGDGDDNAPNPFDRNHNVSFISPRNKKSLIRVYPDSGFALHKIIIDKQSVPPLRCYTTPTLRATSSSTLSIVPPQDLAQVSVTSAERAEQAKYTGHLIYNTIHGNNNIVPPPAAAAPNLPMPESSSDTQAMEELEEPGKMSSVRRTFCLYALFDLGLMFILWVIYTQLIGQPGYKAFEDQVQGYNFKTSLFDTVMLSAIRITLLLLAYGLYRSSRCWIVGFSTALTCGFLVAKIFIFDFEGTKSSNNPLSYCLIIISFVLSWSETWFVDFKMLPAERKLRSKAANKYGRGYGSTYIGGRGLRPDDLRSIMTEDNTFYSPLDSNEGSDNEEGNEGRTPRPRRSSQDNDYIRLARHAVEVLWAYLHSPETEWKLENGTSAEEGLVHSKKVQGVGKVFRLKCYIDIPARELYDYINKKPEEQTDWNATVKECRVLQVVDDHSDILYVVSNELGGGAIQSRDFISLRSWVEKNGILMSAGMGVKHPDMPPQKNYIRGHNGIGGYCYEAHPTDPGKTLLYWFMNTDIKGWFPQKLIDANLASVLVDFQHDITKQAAKLVSLREETVLPQSNQAASTS
ncbi:hypothetical protein RRG08_053201 [Elysia crispata]|uniref:StAR-related lipid transfer protein 3 n=1 Tax=Elysia crispata TaxID=231223 RepID=A0AAE1B6H8_9GAST|nr:hypothetical protein RRG08_053201 [Elysia crispata]